MSSGSGSGSGADPHLLALLRAIRLRQAAPEAVEVGAADTAAALSEIARRQSAGDPGGHAEPATGEPPGELSASSELSPGPFRPSWAASPPSSDAARPGPDHPEVDETEVDEPEVDETEVDEPEVDETEVDETEVDAPPGDESADRDAAAAKPTEAAAKAGSPTVERALWAAGGGAASGGPRPRIPNVEGMTTPTVATPARWAAGDGMDPADDVLLRQTQRLLSTSLTVAGGPDEVAARLRVALRRAHPSLLAILPGDAADQADRLSTGLVWLVHHLDQPPLLVDGCAALGRVLAEAGVELDRLQLVGAALAEATRAGMAPGEWRQEFDLAWRSTWQHLYEWIRHGMATADYQQTSWPAVVVSHELRRPDLAVIRVRPHLPLPFRPGQYARVEVRELPGIWRPYSPAGAPRRNDLIELHVRAKTRNGVSGTLVYRTGVGDQLRLSRPEGDMSLPAAPDRNLLMIAGDTGVAPLKALLTELADTGDPRSAVLFWGVRNLDELYDVDEITEIARSAVRSTVVPVVSEGDPGPYASGLVTDAVAAYGEWSRHEVYLAGPPLMLAATTVALNRLGVAPDHIHHDAPE